MRTFKITRWTWSAGDKKGKPCEYRVTDAEAGEDEKERPEVAIFPVSVLYDSATQEARAKKLADYLNLINSKLNMFDVLSSTDIP